MTQDIIVDTTARFIREDERNLQLAFHVEKALPVVRTELVKEFLECVEKQLKETVKTTEGWEIRTTDTDVLEIRKKSWDKLKVGKHSEDWWGVCLSPDDPSISVTNIKKTSKHVRDQISNEFKKYIGEPKTNEKYIWVYLEDDIKGIESCDFLKKMINKEEQGNIVTDVTGKLAKLAVAVDRVLNNSA